MLEAIAAIGAVPLFHAHRRATARPPSPRLDPVLGNGGVRPRLVIAALLLATAVLTWRAALHLSFVFQRLRDPDDVSGVPHWSLIWAVALVVATVACHRATKAWSVRGSAAA